MPTPSPLRVFISYSSKDKSLLEDLETHLTSLRRQGAILEWSNRAIIAGQDTQAAVSDNLKQADIILLLVSSDFLASQAAWDHEVTQALKRHDDGKARVIPILLRPVDLTNVPFAHLAPLPTNARPITRWSNRDDAWLDVATAIGRVIEQETRQRTCPLPPELPPATFVGRTEEMEVAVRRLQTDGVRMLTISGIFGIGKTRLASEAVLKLRRYFRDGICPVMLSRFDEHGLVASDIRAALDAPESSAQSLESSLQAFLLDKQVLLVLDRFDTARTAESLQLIHGLIGAALGLKVLITSREPIPIQFGYQAELGLLPLRTQRSTWDASGSATSASEAAQLFIAFAETMGTTIDTEHDIAAVESICTKIGGHPQTINLIAGWLKTSPLDQTDADLSEYVILSAGDDEPLRHAWNESFQRLNAGPQSVLAMLSVFRGPFAKEAATEVVQTDDGSPLQVLPVFKVLAERGFLQRESLGDGQLTGRYWIFETIRQYAKEMLDSGQWQAAQHRHATYFLKLAETAELEIEGSRQVEGLADVRDDYSNIRAALRRSKASGNVELSLRLAGALGPYWYHRGDFTEGRTWLKELLASPGMVNPVIRAKALDFAGILASYQGDHQEADASLEEARRLFEELDTSDVTMELLTSLHFRGRDEGIARCLKDLGWVAREQGDFDRARALCTESLELYRSAGDPWGIAQATGDLGLVLLHLPNEHEEAIERLRESLDLRTRYVRQPSGLAMSRAYLGVALYRQGDHDQATQELRQSLEIAESIGFSYGLALTAYYLGMVMYAADAFGESASHFLQSLRLRDHMGDRGGIAACLDGLAALAFRSGRADLAHQLLDRADLERPQITGAKHALHLHSLIGIDIDTEEIRANVQTASVPAGAMSQGRTPTTSELTEAAMVLATVKA